MKKKSYSLTIFLVLFTTLTYAQTKVLTIDGKTLMASVVEIKDESIVATIEGKNQNILKNNVLAIIPNGKSAYTFKIKNDKKLILKRKDMHNNYLGADKPRMYAYKYQGSPSNISQLYTLNGDSSMNEEQFKNIFNEQQKKFKTRNIVSMSLAVLVFLIGFASMTSALGDLNDANNTLNSLQ